MLRKILFVGAVQNLLPGVYIVMNGRIYEAEKAEKNYQTKQFQSIRS